MTSRKKEVLKISTKLLASMLSNPHIYASIGDEEGKGQQEKMLISNAITIAEELLDKIELLPDDEQ